MTGAADGASPRVTDLCDAHGDAARVAAPGCADFGGALRFSGPVHTLSLEDNSLVREALESPGEGRVLVVDGAGRVGETLRFAGVEVRPGDHLYADEDGWIVTDGPLDGPPDGPPGASG